MAVDLRKSPFFLDDEAIEWVKTTIEGMTLEEKIGQMFINLGASSDENYVRQLVENYHIGGARFTERSARKVFEQNKNYQKYSKVPMFVAINGETGGNGICDEGTFVATEAECEASGDSKSAYGMGLVSGREAEALGCNWNFAPMADIVLNWRNTIVNTRSFGRNPDLVLDMCRAYLRGNNESNVLSCVKHFPGDGTEERDQHLVLGVNEMSCEEWDNTFGKVYKSLIEDGLESIMVGHIALPAYSRKFNKNLTEDQIMPATLAPELVQGLLRDQMGFQGVVVTDASHMGGMNTMLPRSKQVPMSIVAGCDMFLFFQNPEEDIQYMMDGYKSGLITEERLEQTLLRILGMKAKLGLHKKRMPEVFDEKQVLGCEEHKKIAEDIADKAITLVKDTQNLLPLSVKDKKRAKLYFYESAPISMVDGPDKARHIVIEELENAGFEVDVNKSYYDYELEGASRFNRYKIMEKPKVEDFKKQYDVVFVFVNMKGYAQENNVRVKLSASHSNELAWWTHEVPTVCVSLNYTNHLYDLPMMKTFINAYAPTRACIKATIDKIVGNSPFKGVYNENVWCDSWVTKL